MDLLPKLQKEVESVKIHTGIICTALRTKNSCIREVRGVEFYTPQALQD